MEAVFGCKPEDILVGVGPCIKKCCHVEKRPLLQEDLPEWGDFIKIETDDLARIDLLGFTVHQLKEVGVKDKNIHTSFCTKDHRDEFFCSQLETAGIDKPGRFASVIMMS